jgi:hypothetical protein
MGWATFWANFSQTHLVTVERLAAAAPVSSTFSKALHDSNKKLVFDGPAGQPANHRLRQTLLSCRSSSSQ